MRPLASPVYEYGLMGRIEVVAGALAVLVGSALADEPPAALAVRAVVAVIFGVLMYVMLYRRSLRRAIQAARPAPEAEREAAARTRRRIRRMTAPLIVVCVVLAALPGTPGLTGAILLGNGAALIVKSRRLATWEREAGRPLLREPRYRWNRAGGRGWGRGRGIMDPQDFYVG